MRVRLKLLRPSGSRQFHRNYPHPLSLIASVAVHVITVVVLLWVWRGPRILRQASVYDEMIKPHESKIVWYKLRELPKITSLQGSDSNATPVPLRISKNVLISDPATADSKQIIRLPEDTPVPVPPVPAPNVIAVKKENETQPGLPAALPNMRSLTDAAAIINVPKAVPKAFVRPDPVSAGKAPATVSIVPVPEPPNVAVSPPLGGTGGASKVDALMLSLLPSSAPVPPGSRSGASTGPATDSPGESRGSGMQIAGVTVRPGPKPPRVPVPAAPPETALKPYVLTSVAPLQNTLSAPLPPSSRTIPQSIESRFHGRVVYAVIIPMKKVPGYTGDWVIWFAEHQPAETSSSATQMRAPLPVRRFVALAADEASSMVGRVQFSAVIDRKGRVDSILATTGRGATVTSEAAIADFKTWEFLPALRNREPVDVDVIVEITFAPRELISHEGSATSTPND